MQTVEVLHLLIRFEYDPHVLISLYLLLYLEKKIAHPLLRLHLFVQFGLVLLNASHLFLIGRSRLRNLLNNAIFQVIILILFSAPRTPMLKTAMIIVVVRHDTEEPVHLMLQLGEQALFLVALRCPISE